VFSLVVVGFAAERELVSCRTSPPLVESGAAAAFGGETGVPGSEETLASATTVDIEALKFRRWTLAALVLLLLLLFSPCCELACKKC
jgi:hypothetical protein